MGHKLKEVREAKKMTQEELAKESGISRGTIAAIESGRAETTTTKTLLKLAKALDVTIDQIFF